MHLFRDSKKLSRKGSSEIKQQGFLESVLDLLSWLLNLDFSDIDKRLKSLVVPFIKVFVRHWFHPD